MRSPAPNKVVERILEFERRCNGAPFLTLIEPEGREIFHSYSGLVARAREWAARFAAAGLLPGDRIVVVLEHGETLYTTYLGALLGGFCPAYFAHPSEKVDDARYCESVSLLLRQIGGEFLVTSRAIAGRLHGRLQVPRGLLDDGSELHGGRSAAAPPRTGGQSPLFLQFSSGTTGLKKGVAISAEALLWQVDGYSRQIALQAGDRIASWLPLYHDMGLIACFFLPLLNGTPLLAMSPFAWVRAPEMLFDAVTRHRATLAWLPNFAFNFLAQRAAPAGDRHWDLSSLRAVVNCSEPVRDDSHRQFMARFAPFGMRPDAINTCYAMAENTFAVTSGTIGVPPVTQAADPATLAHGRLVRPADDKPARTVVGSGRPLPDTEIRIIGLDAKILPEARVGEIAIRTPCLFSGYYGNREDTEAAFQDGFFLTGDLGYMQAGELFVIGRIKDTIIVHGRNLFPQDIEAVVDDISGVSPGRCVAFAIDDPALGTEALVIVAETNLRDRREREVLQKKIREAVTQRMDVVPHSIELVEPMWLLKSTSGKLSRGANRDRFLAGRRAAAVIPGAAAAPPPGASLHEAVRACVDQAVDIGGAGRALPQFLDTDDLLRDGVLDSLSLVGFQVALENRFGVAAARPIRERPADYRSVNAIVAVLGAGQGFAAPPVRVQAQGAPSRPDEKYVLAPQMRDVEAQPYDWYAYLMRRGMPGYRSPTLNSDEYGFRISWRGGRVLSYAEFSGMNAPRGLVLGNSFAYGIGTTHDSRTVVSCLNEPANGPPFAWYNFSLRASVMTQERLALELFAPAVPQRVVWLSGINNLISLIVSEGAPDNPLPFVGERQFAARMMPERQLGAPPALEVRYAEMIRRLEFDVSAIALRLRGTGRMLFCMQPSASWVEKTFSPEERTLIGIFDAAGSILQQAHAPRFLAPLRRRFCDDVAAICARWGVDFADANQDPRLRGEEWLFIDRTHMTDAGHALVADIVRRWLRGA